MKPDYRLAHDKANDAEPSCVKWINFINVIEIIASVLLIPFTSGLSLLGLLAVPAFAALANIATSNYRTSQFMAIQTRIMIEKETT